MPTNVKVTLGILVLAALIGGGYYWYASTKATPAPVATDTSTDSAPAHTLPSGSDTSDDALSQDVASVDADMNAMSSDTAAIDAGLSDKEITQ